MTMQKKQAITLILALVASVACHRAISPSNSLSNSPGPTAQQLALIDDLRKLTETQCGIKAETIDVNVPIQKQGCDDLDLVELVLTIEDKYNVTIPDNEAVGATINSLARIVNRR